MTQTAAQTQDATQDLDEEAIAAALARMKLLPPGQKARCQPLAGGVSSDIWLVDVPGRRLCLNRELPRLKVEHVWDATDRRTIYERNCYRVAGTDSPAAV